MANGVGEGFVLPIGTVTLLLADIEGSTKGWETEPERMRAELAEHDRIVEAALARYGGVRPRDQGEGDAFVAAFSRASDAVACSEEVQAGLTGALKLRIGIHTGDVQLRDEHNYVGPTINRTARIRSAAHGGQTVLSQATYELVRDEARVFRDLGEHRFKDLARPERIWQIGETEFPPLRSIDTKRHNLPVQLTSFVGREAEVAAVIEALEGSRLVTLTGSGGAGKTRLALQVAAELLDTVEGAWFVDLSPLDGGVREAIATVIGLTPDEADRLPSAIGDRRTVILLDNCEHLVEESATVVDELLRSCLGLSVLATSREILGVAGETAWRVPSLRLPEASQRRVAEVVSQSEAVRLFIDRAVRARPGFTIDNENAPAVVAICERVEGIPLAIELAAARVRMMSPQQITDGLADRFRLLTGGARTLMPRQQTLRASVDWSYRLLSEDEKALLRRLSLFVGGWTLEAAEAICADASVGRWAVLDLITRLVDRSLVVADDDRYRMLQTIRSFAAEALADEPDVLELRARFRAYWIGWISDRFTTWWTASIDDVNALDQNWSNVRAAIDDALDRDAIDEALRGCEALGSVLALLGRADEGLAWTSRLAPALEQDPRRSGLLALAEAGMKTMNSAAVREPADRALALLPQDAQRERALALFFRGVSFTSVEPEVGASLMEEAVGLADASGDRLVADAVRMYLPWPPMHLGRFEEALQILRDNIERYSAGGYEVLLACCDFYIGFINLRAGNLEVARAGYERAIASWERLPYRMWLQWCIDHISQLCVMMGDLSAARDYASRGVQLSQDAGLRVGNYPYMLRTLAVLCEQTDELDEGRSWSQELVEFYESTEGYPPHDLASAIGLRAVLAERLGDLDEARSGYEQSLRLARTLDLHRSTNSGSETPPPLASSLGGFARLAARDGDAARAGVLDSAMRAALVRESAEMSANRREYHEAVLAQIRTEAWSAYDAIGAALEPQIACDVALGEDVSLAETAAKLAEGSDDPTLAEMLALEALHGDDLASAVRALRVLAGIRVDGKTLGDLASRVESGSVRIADALVQATKRRGKRKRPSTGWGSLTPIENAVVQCVVEGLTNRQIGERLFISARTVQGHLARIFPKLAVTSRSELAAEAARRDRL